ncbi:hypothetical protein Tco_0823222 [Tanacetum coccineum]|uniref:Uncharacterized protein n=1 Tax=Tanacetum coccineum TaxID=301880 RepID=A0ABQ5ALH6_9ASTR
MASTAAKPCQGDSSEFYLITDMGVVSRFMSNLGREHWETVKWLMRYLKVGGTVVSWMSRIQKCVAMLTTEAKYMAISEAGKELNPVFHSRTNHIKIRYHYIRELVSERTLSLKKILGAKNPVDMLTKVHVPYVRWYRKVREVALLKGRWLRAEGSRLRAEGSDVDLTKRSGGRTLLTQKLLGDPTLKIQEKEKAVEYVRALKVAPLEVVFARPVDKVSSAIDDVFNISKSNVESMQVRSKFFEFFKNNEIMEKVLSAAKLPEGGNSYSAYSPYHLEGKVNFGGVGNVTPWAADIGRRKRVKCYVQGSGWRKKKKGVCRGSGRRFVMGWDNHHTYQLFRICV